jgi:Glutaredoxin-like domain (DUF836)
VLDRAQFSQSPLSAAVLEVRDVHLCVSNQCYHLNAGQVKRTSTLQIRDISSNAAWEAMYSLKIPVLAAADADDSHEVGNFARADGVQHCSFCCSSRSHDGSRARHAARDSAAAPQDHG